MFFEDAKIASEILNITLTSRDAGKNKKVPMCGIPYHAGSSYIKRLVKMSKKVAICEQVGDPKIARGIVKREITRIITPGTWIEEEFDKPGRNYLLSLNKNNTTFGIAWVELSTGEFKIAQIDGVDKLILELNRLKPSEYLIPESLKDKLLEDKRIKKFLSKVVTSFFDWAFEYNTAYSKLISHFHTSTLQGFGCDGMEVAIGAAGANLRYLEETQKVELLLCGINF